MQSSASSVSPIIDVMSRVPTLARRLLHYRKRPETVTSGITPSGDLESEERLGP